MCVRVGVGLGEVLRVAVGARLGMDKPWRAVLVADGAGTEQGVVRWKGVSGECVLVCVVVSVDEDLGWVVSWKGEASATRTP